MWRLSLSSETERVSSFPGGVGGSTNRVDEAMSLSDAAGAFSLRGESAHFAMFGVALGDPLVLGIVADGVVVRVNQDHLEVLVSRVFADPVRVEDAKGAAVTTDTLFGDGLESSRKLDEDTLVHRFAHGRSLWHGLLATTTSHSDSESRLTST